MLLDSDALWEPDEFEIAAMEMRLESGQAIQFEEHPSLPTSNHPVASMFLAVVACFNARCCRPCRSKS